MVHSRFIKKLLATYRAMENDEYSEFVERQIMYYILYYVTLSLWPTFYYTDRFTIIYCLRVRLSICPFVRLVLLYSIGRSQSNRSTDILIKFNSLTCFFWSTNERYWKWYASDHFFDHLSYNTLFGNVVV